MTRDELITTMAIAADLPDHKAAECLVAIEAAGYVVVPKVPIPEPQKMPCYEYQKPSNLSGSLVASPLKQGEGE